MEAVNTLIQERNNHIDTCITKKVSRVTQKVKVYLTNEETNLAIFSTDLGHIFGGDVRNSFGNTHAWERTAWTIICLRYCLHPFTHDLHRHCRVQYCSRHRGTFTPLLSIHIKSGDIITTGQYMIYQTYSNLQFRRLLKNSFHSIHIDLRDTSGEKIPFVSVGITRLVLMFRKVSDIHLY